MIDVKENFKTSYTKNAWCRTCFLFKETQHHLLDCPPIRSRLNGIVEFEKLKSTMIFGKIEHQEKYAKSYTLVLSARDELLTPVNQTWKKLWIWYETKKQNLQFLRTSSTRNLMLGVWFLYCTFFGLNIDIDRPQQGCI